MLSGFCSPLFLSIRSTPRQQCLRKLSLIGPAWVLFFFFKKLFIYFWLLWVFRTVRRLFSSFGEWGLLFLEVQGLLITVASLVAEHGFWSVGASIVKAQWLSCPQACGVFPEQGSNPHPLHWQADA